MMNYKLRYRQFTEDIIGLSSERAFSSIVESVIPKHFSGRKPTDPHFPPLSLWKHVLPQKFQPLVQIFGVHEFFYSKLVSLET